MSHEFVDYVKAEVERAGLLDHDSDYNGSIGRSLVKMAEHWSEVSKEEGFSGMGACRVGYLFFQLAQWRPISPITSDPVEWMDVSECSGRPMWQNRRCPSLFSENGGQTWYDIDVPHLSRFDNIRKTIAKKIYPF